MAEKEKQKRINPRNYWRLRKKLSEFEDAKKAWQKWCEGQTEKMGLYPDCVNFVTGVITELVGIVTTPTGEVVDDRKLIRRFALDNPIFVEAKKEWAKFQEAGAKAEKVLVTTAELFKVPPDCLNPKTGAITTDTIEFVDPPSPDPSDMDDEDDKAPAPEEEDSPDAEDKEKAGQA